MDGESKNAYHREWYRKRIEKDPDYSNRLYRKDRERIRSRQKLYYQTHKAQIQKQKTLHYQSHKREMNTKSLAYLHDNPEKLTQFRIKQKEHNERLKIEVLTHYGNGKFACVKCGENRFPCLSIDHIEGNGAEHRLSSKGMMGSKIYRWLKANNYPEGYQTLCMNCQWVKKYENKEYSKGRPISHLR